VKLAILDARGTIFTIAHCGTLFYKGFAEEGVMRPDHSASAAFVSELASRSRKRLPVVILPL